MIANTVPISRIAIEYAMLGALPFKFVEKSMETETTTWSKFQNGGKATVEQILASK